MNDKVKIKKPFKKVLPLNLDEEVIELLKSKAMQEDRSASSMANVLLKEALA